MGANDAGERGRLIPGLPEELVLAHVIPRLPWYTRPLCRALSKAWSAMLDIRNPELDFRTRMIQLPLLRGLFLFCTFDKQIFIRDEDIHEPCRTNSYRIQSHWRKLPPLHGPLTNITMVASSGMVYVWSNREDLNFVLKLDIGCADWAWNKFPVPHAFNSDAVNFNGKIYVTGISTRSPTDSPSGKKAVFALDMMTDKGGQVESWDQQDLRVLSKSAHSNTLVEEMYSFVEEQFATKLEVLMYDVGSDSWRTREEVPMPEFQWSHLPLVQLLNNDCFEPAPDMGINIIWIDHENEVISWFNSSLGSTWVYIYYYEPLVEGKYLEYIQFLRGSIYGIFCDEQEEQEDTDKEEGGGGLLQRTIMKGRIVVASSNVVWEEVHEIGFFEERYHVDSSIIDPIDCYTLMV